MPDRLEKLRRIDDSVKQALQDRLLGSLHGDGRYESGVSTSLPAPARRSIQAAGVAPPDTATSHPPATQPSANAPAAKSGPPPPPEAPRSALIAPQPSNVARMDPEAEVLERLVSRLDRRGTTPPPANKSPDDMVHIEEAQRFLRELEEQPRHGDDDDDTHPHAEVSF